MTTQSFSPLLIAADKESFEFIQALKGKSLFYETLPALQTLSFCHEQEVWVLYAFPQHFTKAMQLGRQVQLTGSRKVLVIYLNP
jgi:hypothetical protein